MTTAMIILLVLAAALVLALRGRTGHKGLEVLRKWSYAHRGLHGNGVPENSMPAFQKALEAGYGIELDVHLMKDGNLAVIHDASLKRTAGADVKIEDLTTDELLNYHLEGTEEMIPTFRQVLQLYTGKAPMIIELKAERGNHAALSAAVCAAMEGYTGAYCMESFDPRCILWLKKNRPDIIRGQLAENFIRNRKSPLPMILKWILTWNLPNFLTRPDFIAYNFGDRNHFTVRLCRKLWHIQGVAWTLRSQKEYDEAKQEGWIPIFEYFNP